MRKVSMKAVCVAAVGAALWTGSAAAKDADFRLSDASLDAINAGAIAPVGTIVVGTANANGSALSTVQAFSYTSTQGNGTFFGSGTGATIGATAFGLGANADSSATPLSVGGNLSQTTVVVPVVAVGMFGAHSSTTAFRNVVNF